MMQQQAAFITICLVMGAAVAMGPSGIPRACAAGMDHFPFCDTTLPLEKRVDDLIGRLTLEEKPMLLLARESPLGNISRLGLPEYDWGANCVHGVQSRCSKTGVCPTSFPCPNSLGSSFNSSVWKKMGAVIGLELRALWLEGVGEDHDSNLPHLGLDCWSPNINIVRDPRWGRNEETVSEDPLLCGVYGAMYTQGLQVGEDKRYVQAVSTLKHYDANSLEGHWGKNGQITRHTIDNTLSMYDLFSSYLPAFRTAVVEGGALGVMCSYNAINGVPACASSFLLHDILRKEWGFQGYVTSDSGAIKDIYEGHHYTNNWDDTVAAAVSAGCDIESADWPADHPWATGGPYLQYLPEAVRKGIVNDSDIDAALRNTLGLRFRLGLFDPIADQPYWHIPPSIVHSSAHVQAAKDASEQSFVLLKNDHQTLPFTPNATVAVIGPHAESRGAMLGNYVGQVCPKSMGDVSCITSPLEAIANLTQASGGHTHYAEGCEINSTDTSGFAQAISAAEASDVVVMMMGIDSTIEGEDHDRHDISLPATQQALITAILKLAKPTVVVLFHGGILTFDHVAEVTPAIISAGYPGFYGGGALADTLFGRINRFGKTAVTWYHSGFESEYDMLSFDMAAAPGRTYRYRQRSVMFPFGFGLSYTNFSLSQLGTDTRVLTEAGLTLGVRVENVGQMEGDEVILVYMSPQAGVVPSGEGAAALIKQLIKFERITLAPRQAQDVIFTLLPSDLALVNNAGKDVMYRGEYIVTVTNSIDAVPFHVTL